MVRFSVLILFTPLILAFAGLVEVQAEEVIAGRAALLNRHQGPSLGDPVSDNVRPENLDFEPTETSVPHTRAARVSNRKRPDRMFQATVIPGSGDQLGLFEVESRVRQKLKVFPLISYSPQFTLTVLNGPDSTDLPSDLYKLGVDVSLFIPVNEQLQIMTGFTPSLASDMEAMGPEAFRMPARAIALYSWSEQLTLSAGVVFLDRDDMGILPAVGLTYRPQPTIEVDLNFPRPQIKWQYSDGPQRDGFLYVGGELGGGTWLIERTTGHEELVNIRDLRLLCGWQVQHASGLQWSVEGGYVFDRSIEYHSGIGDQSLNGAALLRCSVGY